MPKSGGAAIHMKKTDIHYLVGSEDSIKALPIEPYSDIICDFLDELSRRIRQAGVAKGHGDVLTFAFWCRKSNIQKLKQSYKSDMVRIGRGIVFHIAPSNVPVNFAYSLVFGLLAGNSNIVRVSSKTFTEVNIICKIMNEILQEKNYEFLCSMIQVVSYEKNKEINDYFSEKADARIIWGGDHTIQELRMSPISARAVEINFADRFSFGIINPETIVNMSDEDLKRFAEQFYNDTYLMDQNACSTPHLILWYGNEKYTEEAQQKMWQAVYQEAEKYDLSDIKVVDKYTDLCEYANDGALSIRRAERFENLLYVIELEQLPESIDKIRGRYGEFFQYTLKDLSEAAGTISKKVQSCMVLGIEKEVISKMILKYHLRGIDRVVPFGKSLDIGVIWDGYDIISMLSRIIG